MSKRDAKVVVVTGATRGLGRAMTERLIEADQTVVGCGRSAEAVRQLQQRFGRPHRFDRLDVSSDAQVADWARQINHRASGR